MNLKLVARFLLLSAPIVGCCFPIIGSAAEVLPIEVEQPAVVGSSERGLYSNSTLRLGIRVDRDEVVLRAYTTKDHPFWLSRTAVDSKEASSEISVDLALALLGPNERRFTRTVQVKSLCLEHGPEAAPHVEGDTIRSHRETLLVELPELAGFDRVEIVLRERRFGSTIRQTTAVELLDAARYEPAGGRRAYADLAFAGSQAALPVEQISPTSATVLWPADFGETATLRFEGNPGETDRRINIVVIPDGYTHAQKSTMIQHFSSLVNTMRSTHVLGYHDRFFNYILVYAYSLESGTDECDCGTIRNTAMGTSFPYGNGQCGHIDNRCLYYTSEGSCDDSGFDNILSAELRAPYLDSTIIMVNTTRYGGCGGYRAVYSAGHGEGAAVAVHELGHSLFDLADEYVTEDGCGPPSDTVNTSANRWSGTWPEWISTLGSPREGARYWSECLYRPSNNCKMRDHNVVFCAVCRQHASLEIYGHERVSPTAPIQSISPAPEAIVVGDSLSFAVQTRLGSGAGPGHSITWRVLGPGDAEPVVVATQGSAHTRRFDEVGTYVVSSVVVADTNYVQPVRYASNRDVAEWTVQVFGSICDIGCANDIPECDPDMDGIGNNCDPDDDGDEILDEIDNCPRDPNPEQQDFDGDGHGDLCESGVLLTDINGSLRVDGFDLASLGRAFGSQSGDAQYSTAADLNRDGWIEGADLDLLTRFFGQVVE